jgi:hypothetical protein
MKTIEKITRDGDIQIFEIIESRKELAKHLRNILFENIYSEYADNKIFNDGDTTIGYYDKEGNFYWISEGEEVKRPNISKIEKYLEHNAGTTVIYGDIEITYNEHYGDWETNLD